MFFWMVSGLRLDVDNGEILGGPWLPIRQDMLTEYTRCFHADIAG